MPPRSSRLALASALLLGAMLFNTARSAERDAHTDIQATVEVSRGHYGEAASSTITTMPLVLRHRQGRWTGQVEVPYLRIDSPSRLLPGVGSVGTPQTGARQVVSGLGDVWFKLSHEWIEAEPGTTGIDLTLKVKAPTGDVDLGLGSGRADVALQIEALRSIGPLTWFGHIGYRHTGDLPGARPYNDPWYGELGAMGRFHPSCDAGVFYTHRQAIGRLGELGEATVFGACRFGAQRVQLHLSHGMAPASADWGLGITVRHRF